MKKIIIFAMVAVVFVGCTNNSSINYPTPNVVITGTTENGKTNLSVSSGSQRAITETFMNDVPFMKGAMFAFVRDYPNLSPNNGWSTDMDLIPLVSQEDMTSISFDTIEGNQYEISVVFALQDLEGNYGCYITRTTFYAVDDTKIIIELYYHEHGSEYWEDDLQSFIEADTEYANVKGMSIKIYAPETFWSSGFMPFVYFDSENPSANAFSYVDNFISHQNKEEYAFFDINDTYDDDYVLK